MYLTHEIQQVIDYLRADRRFFNTKIVKAFPYMKKPTKLRTIVIAVSPSKIDAENVSVGDINLYGEYSIDFDVFSPQELGTPAVFRSIQDIIEILKSFYPSKVYVSEITSVDGISCFSAKCTLTFRGDIDFGGADGG